MKIETWVLKYLGLRLHLYADGGETQDMVDPSEKGSTDKPETKFPNDPDLQQLESEVQKSSKTQQEKDELIKVLEQIRDAKKLLEGITAGEKIISRSTEILGKVTKIGDPTDAEYNDIIEKLKKYQEQLGILSGSKEKITARITELDKLVKTKLTGRNVLLRQILSGVKEEQFVFDSEQEGRIQSLKEGAEFTVTFPKNEDLSQVTLGTIIPEGVIKIKVDGKEYSRAGGSKQGEFVDADSVAVMLKQGMKISVGGTRTAEQLKTLDTQINAGLEGKELIEKTALELIRKYGLDENYVLKDVLEKVKPMDEDNEDEIKNYQNPDFVKKALEKYLFENHIGKQVSYSLEGRLAEANKITDPMEREKKIKEIMEPRMEAAIKSNPTDWVGSMAPSVTNQAQVPEFIKILNDFFKQILGFDFLKEVGIDVGGNPQEMMAAQVGGVDATRLGGLSERFESGGKGPEAINPDDNGLPSFGTYQLRADMLKQFAGEMGINGDHTQKGKDTEFAKNWLAKVKEVGVETFKAKEHAFIEKTHYKPQLELIKKTLPKADKFTMTMKNVVWSCAVQHGAANDVIIQAINAIGASNIEPGDTASELKLAEKIYEIRTAKFPDQAGRYKSELQIVTLNLKNVYAGGPIDGNIQSLPATVNPKTGVTQCSKTAALNGARFGLSLPTGDAEAVRVSYGTRLNKDPNIPGTLFSPDKRVVDLFSGSTKYPQYGHRAIAVNTKKDGKDYWVVLDPYLRVGGRSTTQPIPLETYMDFLDSSKRGFKGGVAYS